MKFYIQTCRINAEIEGMKAVNHERAQRGHSLAYSEPAFFEKARELDQLYNDLHEAWQMGAAT